MHSKKNSIHQRKEIQLHVFSKKFLKKSLQDAESFKGKLAVDEDSGFLEQLYISADTILQLFSSLCSMRLAAHWLNMFRSNSLAKLPPPSGFVGLHANDQPRTPEIPNRRHVHKAQHKLAAKRGCSNVQQGSSASVRYHQQRQLDGLLHRRFQAKDPWTSESSPEAFSNIPIPKLFGYAMVGEEVVGINYTIAGQLDFNLVTTSPTLEKT